MAKKFSEIPVGGTVYVVYNSNYGIENSLCKWKISKGYVSENSEYEYKRVISDPYEDGEEYTFRERYIRFEVPEIEKEGIFDNRFGRRYSKYYDEDGQMNCHVDLPLGVFKSDKKVNIWVDVFTEYKDARDHLLQMCEDRKEYLQRRIVSMEDQLKEYDYTIGKYTNLDENSIN